MNFRKDWEVVIIRALASVARIEELVSRKTIQENTRMLQQ